MNIVVGLLALLGLLSIAHPAEDHNRARQLKEAGDIVPLAQILAYVSAQRPGRILEVELRDTHGRRVYHVEFVDVHGVVWYLQFDATQGTLLHMQKEKAQ